MGATDAPVLSAKDDFADEHNCVRHQRRRVAQHRHFPRSRQSGSLDRTQVGSTGGTGRRRERPRPLHIHLARRRFEAGRVAQVSGIRFEGHQGVNCGTPGRDTERPGAAACIVVARKRDAGRRWYLQAGQLFRNLDGWHERLARSLRNSCGETADQRIVRGQRIRARLQLPRQRARPVRESRRSGADASSAAMGLRNRDSPRCAG